MKHNKKVLLISPQDNFSIIGLKYIHYYLLKNNYQSHLLLMPNIDQNDLVALEELRKFISELQPIFIGISLMSHEFTSAREINIFLKRNFPAIPIIWGGIYPTIATEACLQFTDFVCIGEGEKTILEFANL